MVKTEGSILLRLIYYQRGDLEGPGEASYAMEGPGKTRRDPHWCGL